MESGQGLGGGPSYRDLVVWQRAVELTVEVYRITKDWPKDELYGLTNQVRRSATSVPANIAEGQGRISPKEFLHHLWIANGSLCELETHLIVAQRLEYIDKQTLDSAIDQSTQVARPLHGLMRRLRSPSSPT